MVFSTQVLISKNGSEIVYLENIPLGSSSLYIWIKHGLSSKFWKNSSKIIKPNLGEECGSFSFKSSHWWYDSVSSMFLKQILHGFTLFPQIWFFF